MYKLLKSEWFIWSKSKTVTWSVVLALVALSLFPLAVTQILKFETLLQEAFSFPTVWITCSFLNLFPVQLMSFLVIVITCRSMDDRIYRMHLLSGETRTQLLQRKLIFLLVLTLLSVVATFIAGWLCGYLLDSNSYFKASPVTIKALVVFAVQVLFYLLCALAIGMMVKQLLLAAMLYFAWFSFIDRMLSHFSEKIGISVKFFPGKVIESLSLFDANAIAQKTSVRFDYTLLGVTLVWFVLVAWFNFKIFQKSHF